MSAGSRTRQPLRVPVEDVPRRSVVAMASEEGPPPAVDEDDAPESSEPAKRRSPPPPPTAPSSRPPAPPDVALAKSPASTSAADEEEVSVEAEATAGPTDPAGPPEGVDELSDPLPSAAPVPREAPPEDLELTPEDSELDASDEDAEPDEDAGSEQVDVAEGLELEELATDGAGPAALRPTPPPFHAAMTSPPPPPSTTTSSAPPSAPPSSPPPSSEPAGATPPPPTKARVRRPRPWFEDFFNDDYMRTVPPPRRDHIAREVDFIEASFGLAQGATILDVGCGIGLHAVELAARGYLVVGLDLSLPMLSRAADEAQERGAKINFLHGDMREMTFEGAFDAILCWGTSFGYFDDENNRRVVERLYTALKPMGLLLLDVVNRDFVIARQPNLVWFEGDGVVCMEETQFNYFTSRLEVKRTVILDDGRQRETPYGIRLYALHELGQLLHQQGFRVAQVSGAQSMPGVFFGADSSRMLILAERRLATGGAAPPAIPEDALGGTPPKDAPPDDED